jgi:hypothetical protein
MSEPFRSQECVLGDRTIEICYYRASRNPRIGQWRCVPASGMTDGRVDRQISALLGRGERMLRKRRNENEVKYLKTNKTAKSLIQRS